MTGWEWFLAGALSGSVVMLVGLLVLFASMAAER